jgi:hypothetical protein
LQVFLPEQRAEIYTGMPAFLTDPKGGEVDNLQQDVENHVGEEKAKLETLRFYA